MGGGPAEILPPKKQAVVDRLRRRIESYRRHQNDCVPRFDHSFNGVVEQNVQDTLLLKQRFLENKAKRAVKKSEKKPSDISLQNNHSSLTKYATKRSASEDVESNGSDNFIGNAGNGSGVDGPPLKSSSNAGNHKEGLTKFSVEIVQQLEFTTSTANSQISANVTVKAMNTCIKSDPANSPPSSPTRQSNTPHQVIECKREPDLKFVDLEECAAALEKDAAALHGNSSFPSFTELIGDDTSDAFNDLISDISDFNSEFMRDFDFDNAENKTTNANNAQNQTISRQTVDEALLQIKTENKDNSHLHPSCSQTRMNYNAGLEVTKAELSPAAQTLKQMAEQHQVKVAALGVGYGSRLQGFGTGPPSGTGNSVMPAASNSPYNQEMKQEPYSNTGQSHSAAQNNQTRNQGSPGPQGQQAQGQARAGSPGGPRYKSTFGTFTGRQGQQRTRSGPSTLHATQSQQLHTQGHHVQVSLAQSMSAELKSGMVTLGAQQATYLTSSAGQESYCSISQSQSLNFTQQNLRPRATSTRHNHHNVRTHQPVVMEIINQAGPHLGSRQEFSNKPQAVQHPLPRFPHPRMLPLQPMPPSGPLLRSPYIGPTGGRLNVPTNQVKPIRELTPTHGEAISWKHMLLHQSRSAQFHQGQGVAYQANDGQVPGGQVQHVNIPQHQNLGLHHINPTMSVRIHMSQSVSSNPVFTTSGGKPIGPTSGQDHTGLGQNYPSTSTYNSSPGVYSTSHSHPALQQNQTQTPTIPSEFNLDFLEQLPTDSTGHFTDQDLINSLDSTASFNFQDIL